MKTNTPPSTLNEYNDITNTVNTASDDYKVIMTQFFLRNYQNIILEDYDGRLPSTHKILEALQRHTCLGYFGTLSEEVPSVDEKHVLVALEKMQVPGLRTDEGLFWDLASLNSPAHDKAAIRLFLGSDGSTHVRTVG